MPADAWAVQFPVGKCSHPDRVRGQARPELVARVERSSGTRQLLTRVHMLSQSRIDDTLLVREAQRGNRSAFEELVRHYDGSAPPGAALDRNRARGPGRLSGSFFEGLQEHWALPFRVFVLHLDLPDRNEFMFGQHPQEAGAKRRCAGGRGLGR